MDSKSNKRNVIGIVIITLIFGVLSIISLSRLNLDFDLSTDKETTVEKNEYMIALEQELGIVFESENEFENYEEIPFDMLIVPTAYQHYNKPPFEFIIKEDGVLITNRLAKEFDSYGFKVGMKITKINDEELYGKSYLEILERIYCKTDKEIRKFTTEEGTVINYQYAKTTTGLEYDDKTNTLTVYNLDEITAKAIHDMVVKYPELTLDLSYATVNTYDGIIRFLSMFSQENQMLLKEPLDIYGLSNRKITNLNILVKDNQDKGILFVLTCIKRLNLSIKIDNSNLNTTSFYVTKQLQYDTFSIYIKSTLLKAIDSQTSVDEEIY